MRFGSSAVATAVVWSLAMGPTVLAQPAPPTAAVRVDEGYILGVNDELEVTIFGAGPNQVVKSRIKEDGTINVPFLGAVRAIGQTARQLSTDISGQFKSRGIYNNVVVGVEVTQFVSNSVTVFGEVGNAGLYPLDQSLTVAQLMARAGGTRPTGADFILLRRNGEEHRVILSVSTGEWSSSTPIQAGDEIYAPVAPTIYIYGQINSPGSFPIKSDTTVLQALVRAGGPTLAGSKNNITLTRGDKRIKRVDLTHDVQDGDILYVHERLF